MQYTFKSAVGSDVLMLEATGRQMLAIIGKNSDAKGILIPEHMPAASTALKAAIDSDEAAGDVSDDEERSEIKSVSLRSRAWPLITLIDQSLKSQVPITWGV